MAAFDKDGRPAKPLHSPEAYIRDAEFDLRDLDKFQDDRESYKIMLRVLNRGRSRCMKLLKERRMGKPRAPSRVVEVILAVSSACCAPDVLHHALCNARLCLCGNQDVCPQMALCYCRPVWPFQGQC